MGLFRALSHGRRTGTRDFCSNSQHVLQRSLTGEKKEEGPDEGPNHRPDGEMDGRLTWTRHTAAVGLAGTCRARDKGCVRVRVIRVQVP